ncbi:hypothetical protein MesoLjLc_51700 [Mesorhizobium sp. L-8-10]|nr:hypothetical protein MesoLjLc_51700 [Mesorhizobium sp. L-8-10]
MALLKLGRASVELPRALSGSEVLSFRRRRRTFDPAPAASPAGIAPVAADRNQHKMLV